MQAAAPELLRLRLLQGHSCRNTEFLPSFALFQWFLALLTALGAAGGVMMLEWTWCHCCPWNSAHPSLLVLPSAPKPAPNSCWHHSQGLVAIPVVVIPVVVIIVVVTSHPFGGPPYGGHLPALPPIPRPAHSQPLFAVSPGIIYQAKEVYFEPSGSFPTAHPSP